MEKAKSILLGGGKLFICAVLAYGIAGILYSYEYLVRDGTDGSWQKEILEVLIQMLADGSCLFLGIGIFVVLILAMFFGKKSGDVLYRFRYLAAFILFVSCVAAGLNGSSFEWFYRYLGGSDSGSVLLGASRAIRSDEWAVMTPMMLSQYSDSSGAFSYFGEVMPGTVTDMFLVYGQAVADWPIIFRPFYLGYLFLDSGYGISFFWCGRTIALFMASFEFSMLLTEKKKSLSFVYACMILWAPVVQWWFAINGFVEMLIYMQTAVVLFDVYLRDKRYFVRLACVAGVMLCAGGYILTMYPAWQIPMAYILLGLLIWVLVKNFRSCSMERKDWITLSAAFVLFAAAMGAIFYRSWDTVQAFLNTAYPGKRVGESGGVFERFVYYVANIWSAMLGEAGINNSAVEAAQFFWFFPVCYIVPLIVWIRDKKKDILLVIFAVINVFMGVYCVAGFPEVVSKITFMSYTQSIRAVVILELAGLIMMIRAVALMERPVNVWVSVIIAGVSGAGVTYLCHFYDEEYLTEHIWTGTAVVLIIVFFLVFRYPGKHARRYFTLMMTVLMLLCGGLVNPVRQGLGDLESVSILNAISEVHENDPEALWVVEGMGMPFYNVPVTVGAPTVNSTNTYPDLERWSILDPSGKYEEAYNRYANIEIKVTADEDVKFEILSADYVKLTLTLEDLDKIDVTYIWTRSDLSGTESEEYSLELLYQNGNDRIYRIQNNQDGEE